MLKRPIDILVHARNILRVMQHAYLSKFLKIFTQIFRPNQQPSKSKIDNDRRSDSWRGRRGGREKKKEKGEERKKEKSDTKELAENDRT